MAENYIDIGINLTNRQFQNDQKTIIQNAVEAKVGQMILTGTSVRNSEESAALAKKYPGVNYTRLPEFIRTTRSILTGESIAKLSNASCRNRTSFRSANADWISTAIFRRVPLQEKCYEAQLQLAVEINKPLFLHERAAFARFNEITDDYLKKLPKAVVHCFTGTLREAKTYLDKGFYLGFTGAISDVRRFEHLKEVVKYTPLDRLMIETDAPFMLPKNVPKNLLTKYHERRNEPAFLPFVAQTIAEFKGISVEEVARQTTLNAKHFFGI